MLTTLSKPQSVTLALLSVHHGVVHAPRDMTHVAPLHGGINILLGGVMMGGMLLLVICICYCCHKRVQKVEETEQWMQVPDDSDSSQYIFTVEGQCYEEEGVFTENSTPQPSPPPPYHDVMSSRLQKKMDAELPSYDEALKLQKNTCTIYMDQLTYI